MHLEKAPVYHQKIPKQQNNFCEQWTVEMLKQLYRNSRRNEQAMKLKHIE